jgi:Domain of unknown function (DUF4400)
MLFFKHMWGWFVLMLFFMLSIPILPNDGWFSAQRELEINRAFYGDAAHVNQLRAAKTRFNKWFVETGLYEKSIELTRPRSTSRAPAPKGQLTSVELSAFHTYMNQFWDGLLRVIYRWEVNWHWYLIAIISLFAGVNEGLCRRRLLPANVMYVSPANFHLVGHFLIANVIGALLVLPWLPVVMTWWMWIFAIAGLSRFWVYAVVSLPTLSAQRLK